MTRQASRPALCGSVESEAEADVVVARLWEETPFPRLPADAPLELREYVHDVENPKRVYAVYRASRRHSLQSMVEKFIIQLRHGCDSKTCPTPTCFAFRKRAAGKAPLRRYNTTSARTLAIYMASQDNPENALCPNLKPPKEPPAAVHSLVFTPHPSDTRSQARSGHKKGESSVSAGSGRKDKTSGQGKASSNGDPLPPRKRSRSVPAIGTEQTRSVAQPNNAEPRLRLRDTPVSKDYRSFAANVFGTVAFKMLEWLTPNGMDYMAQKVEETVAGADSHHRSPGDNARDQGQGGIASSRTQLPYTGEEDRPNGQALFQEATKANDHSERPHPERMGAPTSDAPQSPTQSKQSSLRNSNTKVRTSSTAKTRRKMSLEPFQPPATDDGKYGQAILSPKLNGHAVEKMAKPPKHASMTLPEKTTPIALTVPPSPPSESLLSAIKLVSGHDGKTATEGIRKNAQGQDNYREEDPSDVQVLNLSSSSPPQPPPLNELLPQSMTRLDVRTIDFLCYVTRMDRTYEGPLFEMYGREAYPMLKAEPPSLRRNLEPGPSYPRRLRKEWKRFVDQSIFSTFSDPHALVRSFAPGKNFIDSHTLWFCMSRMTRMSPSLVLDSLWLASECLFEPPKSFHSARSPTMKIFPRTASALSNAEAGYVMSICLHALVSALPLVSDVRVLREISDVRSRGEVLGNGRSVGIPRILCLQYDDVFSNELAIRLARRLFSALSARRYFSELVEINDNLDDTADSSDILKPLFAQLENSEPASALLFPSMERPVYEARVPTLLLDWAKTILLREWDGHPEFPSDGPFGGALSLIAAMHGNRKPLMIGELPFRLEYLGDRLDSAEMPVTWLSFTPTRSRQHLLDFPFVFSPSSLVTYFRAINFSRMSEYYEEASIFPSRVEDLDGTDSILKESHRTVLHEMMKTASAKFLVLDIRRHRVVEDAFNQLWRREERELLRPLKIHLGEDAGEEGFDSGGVQQEFFRLIMAQCLDPAYGAFTLDERTRMSWFVPGSPVEDWKFEMMGLLVSLAVHNGLTLPVTFPRALYRKLLGKPVCELHHIADGWPELANGLTTLLEWDESDGLVEDIFARTYEFTIDTFGKPISRDMTEPLRRWPHAMTTSRDAPHPSTENPTDASLVTNANRNSYVTDYIHYLTDLSVRPQFEAFARGFHTCLHAKSLSLLSPALLQSVIEGVQEIDTSELRRHARYVGWDANHRCVRDFWSVVRRYDDRMKRKLLEFVTASERVPVGGMASVQFVVQRNGTEDDAHGHLPTAYTCYGTLLLPEYSDKNMLRERLGMALENAQGFGFA